MWGFTSPDDIQGSTYYKYMYIESIFCIRAGSGLKPLKRQASQPCEKMSD